jgi:hypothetical protein
MSHERRLPFSSFGSALLLIGLLWHGLLASAWADDLVTDDLIVQGAVCASGEGSTTCANGETFTNSEGLKIKQATPKLKFEDTDPAGSSTVDWQISVNDGGNKFSIEDLDDPLGRFPFTIEAGAPTNSLYVRSTGNVGINTATPAQPLHIRSGDTPTVRLEQDTSNGLQAQIWEIGGSPGVFFFRNVTNGSTQPFRIRPLAPTDSFVVDNIGRVGIGTFNPQGNLHIFGGANDDVFNGIGPDPSVAPAANAFNFGYSGNTFGAGSGFFNVRPATGVAGVIPPNPSLRFATANTQRMIIDNLGNIGIGDFGGGLGDPGTPPSARLHVKGNVLVEGNVQVVGGAFIDDGTTLNVPDYVFAPDYQLRPLSEVAAYIARERHLPEIPSAQEIQKQGIHLGEMQMRLLKKIEELTLYTLHQDRQHQEHLETTTAQRQQLAAQTHTITNLQEINKQQQQTVTTLLEKIEALTDRVSQLEAAAAQP